MNVRIEAGSSTPLSSVADEQSQPSKSSKSFREVLEGRRDGEAQDGRGQEDPARAGQQAAFDAGRMAGIVEPSFRIDRIDVAGMTLDAIVERVVSSIQVVHNGHNIQVGPAVRIEIMSPQLQGVRLDLELRGGRVTARFEVNDQQAYDLLAAGSTSLKAELLGRGVEVEQVAIDWSERQGEREQQRPPQGDFAEEPGRRASASKPVVGLTDQWVAADGRRPR